MIDAGLLILMVVLGIACFVMGWVFCKIFSYCEADDEIVHPCETIDDIVKREG